MGDKQVAHDKSKHSDAAKLRRCLKRYISVALKSVSGRACVKHPGCPEGEACTLNLEQACHATPQNLRESTNIDCFFDRRETLQTFSHGLGRKQSICAEN